MSHFGTKIDTLLSCDRICNLIKYSNLCAQLPGYHAEFGVYGGGSLEILAKYNPGKNILAFDSFEGLPQESVHDFHRMGDFSGVDFYAIAGYFKMVYPTVRIIKGFSPNVFEFCDSNTFFSFVHVDVDLYSSVLDALVFFTPRMVKDSIMLIDDYKIRSTPGCEKAIVDFFNSATDVPIKYRGELRYWDGSNAPSHNQYIICF